MEMPAPVSTVTAAASLIQRAASSEAAEGFVIASKVLHGHGRRRGPRTSRPRPSDRLSVVRQAGVQVTDGEAPGPAAMKPQALLRV
ncbi:hypothetical protein GCM10027447_33670 [Glycomyces halotolerans]